MTEYYTDGSSLGNPGPGGWAAVTLDGAELSGHKEHTTNNEMEATAILRVLEATPLDESLVIYTDSEWAVKAISGEYQVKSSRLMPIVAGINRRVSARMLETRIEWIRGHAGLPGNELADRVAKAEAHRARIARERTQV